MDAHRLISVKPSGADRTAPRAIPREGQATSLNYSKSKRISAADVEQHLRGKGVCAPVTTLLSMPKQQDGIPLDNRVQFP